MLGSEYGFPGAGWCITSVFLVLMAKPKRERECVCVDAALYVSFRGSIEGTVISKEEFTDGVEKRNSLMVSNLTFVFTFKFLRLKTEASVRYLTTIPMSASLKASVSMTGSMKLNRVGARSHSCFTPLEPRNDFLRRLSVVFNPGQHTIM